MTQYQHFEQLWNAAEQFGEPAARSKSIQNLIAELTAKFELYSLLDKNDKLTILDRKEMKSHLFGKLLLTITQLSMKDGVNVFAALHKVLEEERAG